MANDVSGLLQGTGVALEAEALGKFGAVVGDSARSMTSGIFPGVDQNKAGTIPSAKEGPGNWNATPYASAFVEKNSALYDPKLKFLFKVSFEFYPEIVKNKLGISTVDLANSLTFMVRQIDRPKYEFDYEEVNMYNFRTKVLKGIRHRELNFSFYDDVGNHVLNFVNLYLMCHSPIARKPMLGDVPFENYGFEFTGDKLDRTGFDTSMRGPLPNNTKSVIKTMTIHQVFLQRGGSPTEKANMSMKQVDFVFLNPRLVNFDIDDMDHENGGSFNLVTVNFDFDAMYMSEVKNATTDTLGVQHPNGDMMFNTKDGGQNKAGGNSTNPFVNIIANQANRIVGATGAQAMSKLFGNNGGPAGQLGQILGSNVTGVLGQAARNQVISFGGNMGTAKPTQAPVIDTSADRASVAKLSSQTKQAGSWEGFSSEESAS